MTIRLSWSGLRTHEECKQRSHLARTHKLATLDNKRGYFPGSVTDRVVRRWLEEDPQSNIGTMPSLVEETMAKVKQEWIEEEQGVVRMKDSGDKAKIIAECSEAVAKIEPYLLKYVVPYDYQPDFHFEAPVRFTHPRTGDDIAVLLNGYMDILVRDDKGRWWVWDVKHTRDNGYWRKTIAQLGFYDLAVELQFGQPTAQTGLMQPLCKERIKGYRPSVESRTQLLTRIHAMAIDIADNVQTPRPDTKLCGWCPTRHACVKFTPVLDAKGRKRIAF